MHSYNILLVLLAAFLFGSCSNSSQQEEKENTFPIIPKNKIIVILADIQITEAYIDDLRKTGIQTRDSSMIYFEKVFKKHDITPSEFERSLLYYKKELNNMNDMYTDVITRLNELKAKSEEIITKMKEDSIRQDSIESVIDSIDRLNTQNDTIFVNDSIINTDTNNIIP